MLRAIKEAYRLCSRYVGVRGIQREFLGVRMQSGNQSAKQVACEVVQRVIDNHTQSYRIFGTSPPRPVILSVHDWLQRPVALVPLNTPCTTSNPQPAASKGGRKRPDAPNNYLLMLLVIFLVPLILLISNMYPTPTKVDSTTKR